MDMTNPNVSSQQCYDDEMKFVLDILKDFKAFFPSDASSHNIPISVGLDWCTPKVKVLVDLLNEFGTKYPAFQCVIFVEQRQVASTLSKILQVIPELDSKIKTAFLVGQGSGADGVFRSTDQYPGDPVKLFKDGLVNVRESSNLLAYWVLLANYDLVVATSVAEEGLDFRVSLSSIFPHRSDTTSQRHAIWLYVLTVFTIWCLTFSREVEQGNKYLPSWSWSRKDKKINLPSISP